MELDAPTVLDAEYADAAAHVLTAALRDDPGFTHVMPDARLRNEALQAFYGYIVRDAIRFGTVLAVRDAAGIAGVAISYPPGAHPLPVSRKLAAIPSMARALARSPRQVLAFAQLGSAIDAAFPREPLTYVEALGVRPDAQHRGHGRRLMGRVLQDADHARADCYLETSREVNVPYYESMGFTSLGEFAPLRRGGPPEARMRRTHPA